MIRHLVTSNGTRGASQRSAGWPNRRRSAFFIDSADAEDTPFIRFGALARLAPSTDVIPPPAPPAQRHSRLSILTLAMGLAVMLLSGCATDLRAVDPTTEATHAAAVDSAQEEVKTLMGQPDIDPLIGFLDRYRDDPARAADLALVKAERDKRCAVVDNRYKARDLSPANLKRLEQGYRLACPSVVDDFAARLAEQASTETSDPAPEEPKAPTPKGTTTSQKARQDCYLLHSIANYREAKDACIGPAKAGDAKAQYNMAVITRILQQYPASVAWTRQAVAQGLPEAEQHLGLLYLDGKGVPKDPAQALTWFETAGSHGVAAASRRAGLMYYRGENVAQDYDKAREWFSKAARMGDAQAQMRLGEIYEKGEGVAADGEVARRWFGKAAEQGLAEAQGHLGEIYAKGQGVKEDDMEAYYWLSLAAAGGRESAKPLREAVARALTPEQLTTIREKLNQTLQRRP